MIEPYETEIDDSGVPRAILFGILKLVALGIIAVSAIAEIIQILQ